MSLALVCPQPGGRDEASVDAIHAVPTIDKCGMHAVFDPLLKGLMNRLNGGQQSLSRIAQEGF